jgi:hypothetical protein
MFGGGILRAPPSTPIQLFTLAAEVLTSPEQQHILAGGRVYAGPPLLMHS